MSETSYIHQLGLVSEPHVPSKMKEKPRLQQKWVKSVLQQASMRDLQDTLKVAELSKYVHETKRKNTLPGEFSCKAEDLRGEYDLDRDL